MSNPEEKTARLLNWYDLCGFMIEEAEKSPNEISQLRVCELNNVRAVLQGLIDTGHEASPEEFEKESAEIGQRVRTLHKNPQCVGKHDHMLKKEQKG